MLQVESHSKKFELCDYLTQIDNTFDFFWKKINSNIFLLLLERPNTLEMQNYSHLLCRSFLCSKTKSAIHSYFRVKISLLESPEHLFGAISRSWHT